MKALITGAAGFLGSALTDHLLADGWTVRGVDSFTPYYDVAMKRDNAQRLVRHPAFELVETDLRVRDASGLAHDVDVVFHLAAQPGVRDSFAGGFALHDEHNVLATQRVLEGALAAGVRRFVYTSSSSIYGNSPAFPTSEEEMPHPHSPYGVTKLAGEHLCGLYTANWDLDTVVLRLFTVYGPGQRPDMALHKLIQAAVSGQRFNLFGNGEQIRDVTYVEDVVRALTRAAEAELPPAAVINVGGGAQASMNELIGLVEDATQQPVHLERLPAAAGDVDRTGAAVDRAAALLGWAPEVELAQGVEQQARWQIDRWRRAN